MAIQTTWHPYENHGDSTTRSELPDSVFAYPNERKEPLIDVAHVRNAVTRFDQVSGVTDKERDVAFANIKKAAEYYGVEISESTWHDLISDRTSR